MSRGSSGPAHGRLHRLLVLPPGLRGPVRSEQPCSYRGASLLYSLNVGQNRILGFTADSTPPHRRKYPASSHELLILRRTSVLRALASASLFFSSLASSVFAVPLSSSSPGMFPDLFLHLSPGLHRPDSCRGSFAAAQAIPEEIVEPLATKS